MKIVLIRHAKAYEASDDPQRHLTPEGKEESKIIGNLLKRTQWNFKEILTSPVNRAKETAEIIHSILHIDIKERNELKPNNVKDNLESILLEYDANDSIIMVLHMPDIAEIAAAILNLPVSQLFFSTASAIGINLISTKPPQGILIFLYQPNLINNF